MQNKLMKKCSQIEIQDNITEKKNTDNRNKTRIHEIFLPCYQCMNDHLNHNISRLHPLIARS